MCVCVCVCRCAIARGLGRQDRGGRDYYLNVRTGRVRPRKRAFWKFRTFGAFWRFVVVVAAAVVSAVDVMMRIMISAMTTEHAVVRIRIRRQLEVTAGHGIT